MKIDTTKKYELYLRKQLGQFVKNQEHLSVCIEEMLITFQHGVKFGQGRLDLEIEEE